LPNGVGDGVGVGVGEGVGVGVGDGVGLGVGVGDGVGVGVGVKTTKFAVIVAAQDELTSDIAIPLGAPEYKFEFGLVLWANVAFEEVPGKGSPESPRFAPVFKWN
jgi:hypothetical protein